jgi:hypothetical protein
VSVGHTPGPWSQYANGDQIYGGNGYFICVVQSANPYWDARLIAAASELLEAARAGLLSLEANIEAREADHAEYSFDTGKDATLVLWRERAAAIRAAIAKATGAA